MVPDRRTVVILLALASALAPALWYTAGALDVEGGGVADGGGFGADASDGGQPTTGADGGGDPAGAATSAATGFEFRINRITECGTTCREVTATIHRTADSRAVNVLVKTTIYTGGDAIWRGEEAIGTLEAGGSYRTTKVVELGYADALKIKSNDGWITIETVITFDGGTEVFRERRQVA